MARTCLLLLLLCLACALFSQPRYTYFSYTTENGMPSNGIRDMYFDSSTGFLWLATEAGLVRFNGSQFRIFDQGSHRQVITGRMAYMLPNTDGNMYAVDMQSRLYRIEKQTPVFEDSAARYPNLLGLGQFLYVSQKMYDSWLQKQNRPSLQVYLFLDKVLALSDTSGLIISSSDSLLYYFSVSNPDLHRIASPAGNFENFFMAGNRCFLIDVEKKLYEFNLSSLSIKKIQPGFPTYKSDQVFWKKGTTDPIYTSGKNVFTIHIKNGVLQRELICDSLPSGESIAYIEYHKAIKTLFLATLSNGLIIIRKNSVEAVRRPQDGTNLPESYYSQWLLPNGNIMVNSNQQIGKAPMMKKLPPAFFGNQLYFDGDSITWYVHDMKARKKNGFYLHSYHTGTGKITAYTRSPDNFLSPFCITKSKGNLYMLTTKGLCMLQRDSVVLIDDRFCKPRELPTAMMEIKPGVLVLGTSDYAFLYDIETKKADTILVNKSADIRTIWRYRDYIFIGTYGRGIFIYHEGKTKAIPLDKYRHLLFAHCFMPDAYGYCWISSNSGLFKVKITDMIEAFANNNTVDGTVYYHYYGKNDGMAITEMNGGCTPCAIERQDKTISFPTMLGLLWVKPAFTNPEAQWKGIYVDAFSANEINIDPDSLAYKKLPFNTSDIHLKISYAAWENIENVYIQYRFEKDSTWKWLEPGGNIVISNPGYGTHHLQIRKINGFDKKYITVKDIQFTIAQPLYTTWWFYTLMVVCALGLIYLYMRVRTRQYIIRQHKLEALIAEKTRELKEQNTELEKRDSIKNRLISIINHDIITPLKFVAATGRNLREKRKLMSDEIQDEIIDEMVQTSKELQTLSTNILNWIKYQSEGKGLIKEPFILHDMCNVILKVLNPVAQLKSLQVINNIPSQLEVFQYYDPLKVLIYNLVSNSIKFTQKGSILIGAEETDHHVTVWVSDEGIGMTDIQVQNLLLGKTYIHSAKENPGTGHGIGYQIIRDLLMITGATIHIESKQEKGTVVLIKFMKETAG